MNDLSTERLGPTSRVSEAEGQPSKRESPSKLRRRPVPPSPSSEAEPDPDPEEPTHQIDRLA